MDRQRSSRISSYPLRPAQSDRPTTSDFPLSTTTPTTSSSAHDVAVDARNLSSSSQGHHLGHAQSVAPVGVGGAPHNSSLPSRSSLAHPAQHRQSLHPGALSSSSGMNSTASINRNRQYTHLQSQLAQLNAHLADLENLVGMTAVQADCLRGLGAWWGAAFMASSKVLGEEKSTESAQHNEDRFAASR